MTILKDIKNLKVNTVVSLSILFLSIVAPGSLILFIYKPELVQNLDALKLVILSSAMTAPPLMFLLFTSRVTEVVLMKQKRMNRGQVGLLQDWYVLHGVNNSCMFYFAIFVAYMMDLNFRWLVLAVLLFTILGVLLEAWRMVVVSRNPNLGNIAILSSEAESFNRK